MKWLVIEWKGYVWSITFKKCENGRLLVKEFTSLVVVGRGWGLGLSVLRRFFLALFCPFPRKAFIQ